MSAPKGPQTTAMAAAGAAAARAAAPPPPQQQSQSQQQSPSPSQPQQQSPSPSQPQLQPRSQPLPHSQSEPMPQSQLAPQPQPQLNPQPQPQLNPQPLPQLNPQPLPQLQPLPQFQPLPPPAARRPQSALVVPLYYFASDPVVAAFCAGGVAGAISRTVVSPLERLKILFQVQTAGREAYKLTVGQGLAKMWRDEGWRGFMRGNGTNCIRIVPYSAVQFSSFNFYQKHIFEESPGAGLGPFKRLMCGGVAGITSVFCTYPLDIVRTRLSIQSASFSGLGPAPTKLPGMYETLVRMYRTEGGLSALYRGIIPTIAGVAPYVGLNFMVYESVRKYLTPPGEKNPSAVRKLLAGAISGAVAQTFTYPFDVLRRRFQINTMSGIGYQYKSLGDAIRTIVAREGVMGLYKGIIPNLLKVAPSMASSWLSYEVTRDLMLSLRPEENNL